MTGSRSRSGLTAVPARIQPTRSSVRASTAPDRVSVSPRQPLCQLVSLVPTSSARPAETRKAGPPASPRQRVASAEVPCTAIDVGVVDSTVNVAARSCFGTHSDLVRPYPAIRRVSPACGASLLSAIGLMFLTGADNWARAMLRSGCGVTDTTDNRCPVILVRSGRPSRTVVGLAGAPAATGAVPSVKHDLAVMIHRVATRAPVQARWSAKLTFATKGNSPSETVTPPLTASALPPTRPPVKAATSSVLLHARTDNRTKSPPSIQMCRFIDPERPLHNASGRHKGAPDAVI
jgi:hypothetical protein